MGKKYIVKEQAILSLFDILDGKTIADAITELTLLAEQYPTGVLRVEYSWDWAELVLDWERPMTEGEKAKVVKKEQAARKARAAKKIKKEEQERKELERLQKKYGGSNG